MSILIVGAGFTGSVLCKALRVTAPELTLTVWEKSRGAGGRQATKRHGEHSCDIGAQYLTHWKSDEFFKPYINVLKSTQVIHELKVINIEVVFCGLLYKLINFKTIFTSMFKLFVLHTEAHSSIKFAFWPQIMKIPGQYR